MKITTKYIDIKFIITVLLCLCTISVGSFAKSTFSADRVKQYCENYINANFQNVQSIDFLVGFSEVQFTENDVNAKIEYQPNQNSSIQKLQIIFFRNEKYLKIYEIPFRLNKIQEVYIAQRDIHFGEIISKNDFILSKSETLSSPDIISDSRELENKIAKRTIKKGEILKSSYIEPQKIINRGRQVQIEVISGGIMVKTTGTSLDDASIGNIVRVRRDGDAKATLTGKVNEEGIVQIILK